MPLPTPLDSALRLLGLRLCGGFHPDPDELHVGGAGTLLVIGNAGAAMWAVFDREVPPKARASVSDPLDDWIRRQVGAIAQAIEARAIFPTDGPPFAPFQRWALRAEPVYPSPLGILIHPTFGLWHAYRAALAISAVLALPPRATVSHPCDACSEKPCLAACPAAALTPDGYDVPRCAGHVRSAVGGPCRDLGCNARRACPIGQTYRYPPDQAAFHMQGFLARLPATEKSNTAADDA